MSDNPDLVKEGLSRLVVADCYFRALTIILEHRASESRSQFVTELPANMLAGFSVELLLKGFLLLQGVSSKKVEKMGHRIDALLEEARKLGLPDIEDFDALASTLGQGHANLTYRYINSGQITDVFNWARVLPIIEVLFTRMQPFIIEAQARAASR